MTFHADGFAAAQVAAVGFGVRDLQEVRWNGTAVVFGESLADVVAGRAFLRRVKGGGVFEQLLHPVAVCGEHLGHVGLGPAGFAEPPDGVHGVLRPELALVDPLDGAGEFRRVVPVKILGEMEAEFVAEMDRHAEVVEAARGRAGFVSAAEVEDEAAVILELAMDEPGEVREPRHVFGLGLVAVFLFALESEGRAGQNEVHAGIRQRGEQVERIAAIRRAPVSEAGGRM